MPGANKPESLRSVLVESLRGSQRDYTAGALGPAILALAVPMVLEMAMESVFVVTDIFFVGKLGAVAVAVVGLCESLLAVVYTVALGLSIGAAALVARRIGERDHEGAAFAGGQALTLGMIVAAALGIAGVAAAPPLLRAMGATPGVVSLGTPYARVMLGGDVVILTLYLANAICRGAGDGAVAMRSLCLANGLNVRLNPALVFGIGALPGLGVTGAAVATTVSRGIGAAYAVRHLRGGRGRLWLAPHHVRPNAAVMLRIVKLSAAATLQVFIGTASWTCLVRLVARFGSEAVAGYTIGIRIVLFALLPSFGLSNAAATMVGQALGAGKPERAAQAVWRTGFYNMCFLGVISVGFVLLPRAMVGLFTSAPAVVAYGADCVRFVALGFVFYAYGMVFTQAFNGAGDTWTPTVLNLLVFWAWEIPLAYVLAVGLGFGPDGIFAAITAAFSALAVTSGLVFRRGKWKTKSI